MTEKFDPAPFDKHAEKIKEALKEDAKTKKKLDAGLVGGSFPASDPISATQPARSVEDADKG